MVPAFLPTESTNLPIQGPKSPVDAKPTLKWSIIR